MDNPGLQPSITPPPAPPLVPPPVPPINEPPKENPIIQTPSNLTVKKAKKFLPKLAVGTLVMALLVGGLFLGKNLLQEKQRPVEKKAESYCQYHCDENCIDATMCPLPDYDATCTDSPPGCTGDYAFCSCEYNGGGGGEICNNESPTVTDCRGQAVGYEFCFQNTANMYCSKISLVGGNIWNCGQDFGGNACGGGGGNPTSGTCGNGNPFNNQCVVIYCPNGDTNGDGACEVPDQGAWYGQRHTCGTVSFGANECGQIDPVDDNGAYCQLDGWSYTIKLNNCSGTPLQSPEPSPSVSPSPSPLCTIQGYKVIMPGNQKIEPASSQTVTLAGDGTKTTNPYYFNGVSAGNKTVSVSTPDGYTVGYTLCINNINCHTSSPTPGSSVTFDCPVGNYPTDGYADLWWHYTLPTPTLACVDLTKDITAPTLGDQVTFTCEASFSAAAPIAQFRTSTNGGVSFNNPTAPKPIDLVTKKASEQFNITEIGNWVVQCRVCTDDTKTTCTTWGQAQ